MDSLYLLQFGCFLFMVINVAYLLLGSFLTQWQNLRYEHSRHLIIVALVVLALQYLAQMGLGIRAASDAYGALLNALIYPVSFSLISIAIYHIEATHSRHRKLNIVSLGFCMAIWLVCGIGYLQSGSPDIGVWLYVAQAVFLASVIYDIVMITTEMRKRRKMLETMAATDMLPYVRYSKAGLFVLFAAALVMPVAIISTQWLMVVGPVVLCALFFFLVSFQALGNNYVPSEELLDKEVERVVALSPEEKRLGGVISDEMKQQIGEKLEAWCAEKGYKDSAMNLMMLSRQLEVSKSDLSIYFDQCVESNFRIWLSDIRFEAAKKMMLANPHYSNDVISAECGFSSRSQLYRIFNAKVGCSPNVWSKRKR